MPDPVDICYFQENSCKTSCDTCQQQADRVLAALAKAGYAVVPLEPDYSMKDAGSGVQVEPAQLATGQVPAPELGEGAFMATDFVPIVTEESAGAIYREMVKEAQPPKYK